MNISETNSQNCSFLRKISPQMRFAFFSALICGLLAHGMALFNKLSWHDDLYYLFDVGATVSSGRWTLHLLYWLENLFFLDGHFSMPLFNGCIAIACIGAAAGLLVNLFRIRSKILSAALGCLMVTFPVITGLFTYVFTIHYYMAAMMLMVSAAYLLCRDTPWWVKIIAVFLGSAALGIYQAFLPLIPGIILLHGLMELSEGKTAPGQFWKGILLRVLCTGGMLVLYFIANKLFQIRLGLVDITYPGMEGADSLSPAGYLARIGRAYREFFLPVQRVSTDMYPLRVHTMYQLMLLGDLILSVRLLIRIAKTRRANVLPFVLFLFLIPLAGNFIFVMADQVHGLMTYGQIIQMVLFIWLTDRLEVRPPNMRKLLSFASAAVLAVTGLLYIRLANQCYLKINFEQQEAISFFTALVTQIKSSEDYQASRPVLFVNEKEIVDPTVTHIRELDVLRTISYEFNTLEYLNNYTWSRMMEIWCGFTPIYSDRWDLTSLPEVQAMPHYPDAGSIQLVQDVLVVHF